MKGKHPLITHPVGRMKSAARWYIAAIAMMSLVLIAIHFAMQVFAQEEAKRLVSEWQKQSGRLSVGDVRYRMLLGALTLVDVRYQGGGIEAYAPAVFLQGNLSSLGEGEPKASAIELRGAQLSMDSDAIERLGGQLDAEANRAEALFLQLWSGAQHVGIYQAQVELSPGADSALPHAPVHVDLVRLEAESSASIRDTDAFARVLGGELRLEVRSRQGEGQPSHHGSVTWSGMRAAQVFSDLAGLAPTAGTFGGSVSWQPSDKGNGSYAMLGTVDIQAPEQPDASLRWSGEVDKGGKGGWRGEIKAGRWPLAVFAQQLPQFQGFQVAGGRVDGDFRCRFRLQDGGDWDIGSERASLNDLRLSRSGEKLPDWSAESVTFAKLSLKWPARKVRAAEIVVHDGMVMLDPAFSAGDLDGWSVAADAIRLEQLTPGIALAAGEMLLPPMQGSANLSAEGFLRLKLSSLSAKEDDQSDMPRSSSANELWRVSGEGMLTKGDASRLSIDVRARRASLVRFRELMPEMIRKEASAISGEVDLNLHLVAGSVPWVASGDVSIVDAGLQYEGGSWSASRMQVTLEKIGRALPLQQVKLIAVKGWSYEAVLRPLGAPQAVRAGGQAEGPKSSDEAGAAAGAAPAEPWHIAELQLEDGAISVGQADALWIGNARLKASDLYPGSAAPVEFRGSMGGGALSLDGTLNWTRALPTLNDARISVRDALPFFLNDWLAISGAPRIIRGRLYADIKAKRSESGYQGMGYLRLQNGQLGPALSADDPLLVRVGMNSHDVFSTLQKKGRVRLSVPIRGGDSLSSALGASFVAAIDSAVEKNRLSSTLAANRNGALLSSVRLHEEGSLSQNERSRLRTVVRYMLKNKKSRVELKPQLSISSPLEQQAGRVRYTQRLIESFLSYRGVSRSRIFPVWPLEQHRSSGSSSGVRVVTLP